MVAQLLSFCDSPNVPPVAIARAQWRRACKLRDEAYRLRDNRRPETVERWIEAGEALRKAERRVRELEGGY